MRKCLTAKTFVFLIPFLVSFPLALAQETEFDKRFIKEQLRRVREDRENNNLVDAIMWATGLANRYPNNAEIYYERGTTFHKKNLYTLAIVDYRKSMKLKPDYAEAYHGRALAYSKKGNYEKAIKDYTKAIELKPDYAEAYCDRGEVYHQEKKMDLAIADYTKTLELYENRKSYTYPQYAVLASFQRGTAYHEQEKIDLAIADYTKVILHSPMNPQVYYFRGLAYQQKGDNEKASEDLIIAIELNPDFTDARAALGNSPE